MVLPEDSVQKFEAALLSVNRIAARELLENALVYASATECLDRMMTPTLEKIGERWEAGDAALSQVYMSGIICEELIESLLPQSSSPSLAPPRIAVVTFEDYHVLGKRILRSILAAQGVWVLDYGHGVQKDELLDRLLRDDEIEVLLISTLMLPSALRIRLIREGLDALGRKVHLVVGGAPFRFDPQLWKRVGADAMGRTASDAIRLIRHFEEGKS